MEYKHMNWNPHCALNLLLLATAVASLAGCSGSLTHAASHEPSVSNRPDSVVLACQGRVEGRTESLEVGAAADGVIQTVYVKEGDRVSKGAKLAEIGCPDLHAELSEAVSQVN